MSRVGKKPITIPSGVTVTISDSELEVKGPKGTLNTPIPAGVSFKQEDGTLDAERANDDQAAFHGLARALANNAVVGVTEVYQGRWISSALVTRPMFRAKDHVLARIFASDRIPAARWHRSKGRTCQHKDLDQSVSD